MNRRTDEQGTMNRRNSGSLFLLLFRLAVEEGKINREKLLLFLVHFIHLFVCSVIPTLHLLRNTIPRYYYCIVFPMPLLLNRQGIQ